MKFFALLLFVVAGITFFGASCGGDECKTAGSTSECGGGTVCDSNGTALSCLKICTAQGDCDTSENCEGVSSSSLKACHPTSSSSPQAGGW